MIEWQKPQQHAHAESYIASQGGEEGEKSSLKGWLLAWGVIAVIAVVVWIALASW